MTSASAAKRSAWARWRVDLRLASRAAWRAKGSSALVALLVALPVAGLAGAAVTAQSHIPSRAQSAELELGQNQAWVRVVGGADPSRRQAPDEPYDYTVARKDDGTPLHPAEPSPTDPAAFLPAGTRTIEIVDQASLFVDTETGTGRVVATSGPVWDPVFRGRYAITSGSAPTGDSEAMVTEGMLPRLGAIVGDRVTLTDSGKSFTITGTVRRLDQPASAQEVYLPAGAVPGLHGVTRWFTPAWQPTAAELERLNHAGLTVYGRDLVIDPPGGVPPQDLVPNWGVFMVVAMVAVFCAYLVVMLAGAAFSVAARRQQRAFAVIGSVGASRGDVFRIVLLQGTVLGLIGGVAGTAAGIALAAAFLAVTDDGVLGSFWGNWGFRIPWELIVGVVAFAIAVGTLAALVPARAATKGDALEALRGARRPARLDPHRPKFGVALMIAGLAGTVAGGLILAAANLQEPPNTDSPLRTLGMWCAILSPIAFQVGILFAGHWVLAGVARVAARLGSAPRLASRDAAANPSRAIPAFAAIAVCVFLASFGMSAIAASSAGAARTYGWGGPLGSAVVAVGDDGTMDAAAVRAALEDLLASTHPDRTISVEMPRATPSDENGSPREPHAAVWTVASPCHGCSVSVYYNTDIAVVSPDDLAALFDQAVPAAAVHLLRQGGAIDVSRWNDRVTDATVTVAEWTAADFGSFERSFNAATDGISPASADPVRTEKLPAMHLSLARPQDRLGVIISPATAERLGIHTVPHEAIGLYAAPVTDATIDSLNAAAQNLRLGDAASITVQTEHGPAPSDPWLWLVLGATGVLVIGASAVSLGLARVERRPDDATLAAIGASRGIRRRVNAWQAVVIAGIGTVVGTIAGLIPMWGIAQSSSDHLRFEDAPWLWLLLLAVGLPTVIAAAAWLVPPRHPDLTRRTVIA